MMIRTAGGPGTVSPIDFHERKTRRFSRTTWTALGIVIAAHLGLGVALYYKRFEMPLPAADETSPPIIELITLPKPEPKPVIAKQSPAQAPNTNVNNPPMTPAAPEPIHVVDGEEAAKGPVTSFTEKAPPDATPDATSPKPAPPAPPVINNPSWIRQPSADQLMRAYPDQAIDRGVGGTVMLNCLVQPNGRVADCRTTSEPAGPYGFGRAAQSLTRHFQISPRTVNGAAEGSRVNIAIRFNPPPAE